MKKHGRLEESKIQFLDVWLKIIFLSSIVSFLFVLLQMQRSKEAKCLTSHIQ